MRFLNSSPAKIISGGESVHPEGDPTTYNIDCTASPRGFNCRPLAVQVPGPQEYLNQRPETPQERPKGHYVIDASDRVNTINVVDDMLMIQTLQDPICIHNTVQIYIYIYIYVYIEGHAIRP